jgi:uncharacterized RDD family membrane protein YckC
MPRGPQQLDSSIEIVTPENISFRYEVAGPFRRLPAFLIDLCLRLFVLVAALFAMAFLGMFGGFGGWGILLLLWFVLEWFYGGLLETFWNGQTVGKRITGLRVLSVDGQPISGLQAVLRNILRTVDMMPVFPLTAFDTEAGLMGIPTCLIGLLTPVLNPRFQRLGDLVCGTMVVVESRSWLIGVARIDDPRVAQLAESIPANFAVNKQVGRALAAYLERRKSFAEGRRREIARHLADPLIERFRLRPDTDPDLLICALYHRAFIADQGAEVSGELARPRAAAEMRLPVAASPNTASSTAISASAGEQA